MEVIKKQQQDQTTIADYYDQCLLHFQRVWFAESSLAMHFGYWDEYTLSHAASLSNMNKVIASLGNIRDKLLILDAGCGVGDSCIWIGQNFNTRVIGITLSSEQVKLARRYASERGVEDRVSFYCQDYTNTNFGDRTFDVVWAVESVCHSSDKRGFLAEARRILKPKGRLVVADFWANDDKRNEPDEQLICSWLRGWAVPP